MKKIKTRIRKALANKFSLSSMELNLVNYLKGDLKIVIDVGANQGNFTKILRSLKPIDKVFLCEANENSFSSLEQAKLDSDVIIPFLISNKVGEEKFFIYETESTSSLFGFDESMKSLSELNLKPKEERNLKAITIDHLMKENNLSTVDLLKIDVQGAEMKVLEGAVDSLSRIKNIWVEVSMKEVYKGTPVFPDVYDFLSAKGFLFKSFSPVFKSKEGEILQSDVLFVNSVI